MRTALSQNARAPLAHLNTRLSTRNRQSPGQIPAPRMRALRSRIATQGSTPASSKCVCTALYQNARASLAHCDARLRGREPANTCTPHSTRMRALRWRIANHGSKLTSGNAASNALIRADLSISTPPPATLIQIKTDQRRADRCGRPSTEPGRAENPQIQASPPQARSTPSNGGPARSDARRSVPQRSASRRASWPARKAFAKAAQRLKTHFDLKGSVGQQRR